MCRFAQSLLCKPFTRETYILSNTSYSANNTRGSQSGTIPGKGKVHLKCNYNLTNSLNRGTWRLTLGGTDVVNKTNLSNTSVVAYEYTGTTEVNAGTSYQISFGTTSNATTIILKNVYLSYIEENVIPDGSYYFIPTETQGIGEKLTFIFFGKNSDGEYTGIISLEDSSSATAGSITPGNFVGYIKVLYNGDYIKIPYYGN